MMYPACAPQSTAHTPTTWSSIIRKRGEGDPHQPAPISPPIHSCHAPYLTATVNWYPTLLPILHCTASIQLHRTMCTLYTFTEGRGERLPHCSDAHMTLHSYTHPSISLPVCPSVCHYGAGNSCIQTHLIYDSFTPDVICMLL